MEVSFQWNNHSFSPGVTLLDFSENFREAMMACKGQNGKLAEPTSRAENELLIQHFKLGKAGHQGVWIGVVNERNQ